MNAPECIEIIDTNPNKISVLVKWSKPSKSNGVIVDFTLFRNTLKKSISFEKKFNDKNSQSKVILYVGKNYTFIDYNVEAFCTYEYLVEVKTKVGSTISPVSRVTTRSTIPMFLNKVGVAERITNDSFTLKLNAPIYLNGQLTQVFLILVLSDFEKEILIYPRISSNISSLKLDLTASELLNILNSLQINNLKPNTSYEIKSKFCNSAGCLISSESIFIQTLNNDKILNFTAVILTPSKVKFSWKFSFGVTNSNASIE